MKVFESQMPADLSFRDAFLVPSNAGNPLAVERLRGHRYLSMKITTTVLNRYEFIADNAQSSIGYYTALREGWFSSHSGSDEAKKTR